MGTKGALEIRAGLFCCVLRCPARWRNAQLVLIEELPQSKRLSVCTAEDGMAGASRSAYHASAVAEVLAYQDFVQHVHREEDLDQPAFHGLSTPLIQDDSFATVVSALVLCAAWADHARVSNRGAAASRVQETYLKGSLSQGAEEACFLD